ncbi:MAG: glycosyltransferase family 39 protein [Rhodospirillales bacterium]|nr:glycosyltransferase family 39 protein [Rhodospirillales bacterium]
MILAFGGYLRAVAIDETVVIKPIRADAAEYYISAYNLYHHNVYSASTKKLRDPRAELVPDALRPPGLPLVITPMMKEWPNHKKILGNLQDINLMLGVATIFLVFVAAARVLSPWATLTAALLTAISPHLVSFSVYMLTETPSAFFVTAILVMGAVWTPDRRIYYYAFMGVLVGVAAMVRLQFLLLPFLLCFLLFLSMDRRKWFRGAGAMLLGFALVAAPWFIRNAVSVPADQNENYMARTLAAGAYADLKYLGDDKTFPYPYLHDPQFKEAKKNLPNALSFIGKRTLEQPYEMLKWYIIGKIRFIWQFDNVDGIGDVFIYAHRYSPFGVSGPHKTTRAAMKSAHWVLIVLAAIGAVGAWLPQIRARYSERAVFVLRLSSLFPVLITGVFMVFWPAARFAVPVYPAVFLLSAFTMMHAVSLMRDLKIRRRLSNGPSE